MQTIYQEKEIEKVLKALDRMKKTADTAGHQAEKLENKVDMFRLAKKLEKIRHDLRMEVFAMDDAIELASTAKYCSECKQII